MSMRKWVPAVLVLVLLVLAGRDSGADRATAASQHRNFGEQSILTLPDNGNSGLLVAQSAQLATGGSLKTLSFYVTNVAGSIRLGLYDNSGPNGFPGKLLAQTASTTAVAGWNSVPVTHVVSLAPGRYW